MDDNPTQPEHPAERSEAMLQDYFRWYLHPEWNADCWAEVYDPDDLEDADPAARGLRVQDDADVFFANPKTLRRFTAIDLSGAYVSTECFSELRRLPKLEALSLATCNYADDDLLLLADANLQGLAVDLPEQSLSRFQPEQLDFIKGLHSLRTLSVNGAGDVAAARIAALPNLETVWLDWADGVTGEGLAALAKSSSLTTIGVHNPGDLDPAGFAKLAHTPGLHTLEITRRHSYASGTKDTSVAVTDDTLDELLKRPLKAVAFAECRITAEGAKRLQACPTLDVLHLVDCMHLPNDIHWTRSPRPMPSTKTRRKAAKKRIIT